MDIFFGSPGDIELDPQQEWLMAESRNGFFEGHRHVLKGLQTLQNESFPLSEHIVDLKRNIEPPKYVLDNSMRDCSSLYSTISADTTNIDITKALPNLPCDLDFAQLEALQRILSKRLAMVQGPPGSGKTWVSVLALRVMLQNMKSGDPPIIVAAHTNHALDQLLRLISKFEPDFIRLGGMTTDLEIVKPRTLYEIKRSIIRQNPPGSLRAYAMKQLRKLTSEIKLILKPLTLGNELLSPRTLEDYHIISSKQNQSLIDGAKEWFSGM